MKRTIATEIIGAAVSLLLFGTAALAYAQKGQGAREAKPGLQQQEQSRPAQKQPQRAQQQQQQARPAQQQPQRAQQQQARPPQQQPQRAQQQRQLGRPTQQRAAYSVPQRTEQQARGWQEKRGWQHGGGWKEHDSWQQNRAREWQVEHRTWAQRGGYGGYYIPLASFTLNFGNQHWFRIQSRPVMVGGYPRFRYGGYSFVMVDPWPERWAEDWYANDDVYVAYDNGYYLHNRRYPGQGIAISVVF